jgi:ABC-type multidrug transport system ATPase subunit
VLAAENLGKRYGARWILRHIDFRLEPGNVLVVLGPNGSGKSTLLKLLAGLVAPSEGSVLRPPGEIRAVLGYAAIDLALYPTLTIEEHLELTAQLRGCESRVEELVSFVGLADAKRTPLSACSTGMRNRLKLALAIQHRPPVLLLDEPTATLDESGRELIARVIESQKEHGVAVVATNVGSERSYATHELELVD